MADDPRYQPGVHYFCAARSNDPDTIVDYDYFSTLVETQDWAAKEKRSMPYIWMSELGLCQGRTAWMVFWWSDAVAESPGYTRDRGRGRGYFDEDTEGFTKEMEWRTFEYSPLDPAWVPHELRQK
jgi:hypothetical protein